MQAKNKIKTKIKKEDRVMVMTGRDKGKLGKVLRVNPGKGRVLVEKVNMIKRHQRGGGAAGQGGIIEKEAPIALSNVALMCDKCSEPVKVGRKVLEDGSRVRVCRKCGEELDK